MKADQGKTPKTVDAMRTTLWTAAKVQQPKTIYIQASQSSLQVNKFDILKTNVENPQTSSIIMTGGDSFDPKTDSLHASMRPIILLANCFSLLPICGVNTPDATYLKFNWRSPKLFYNALSFTGAVVMTVYNVLQLANTGISASKTTSFVFYGTSLIASILFTRLAKLWPCLVLSWEKLEQEFKAKYRKVSKMSLASRFKLVTAIVMVLALIEHTLSILKGYSNAIECINLQDNSEKDIVVMYFKVQFPQVFSIVTYSIWKAVLVDAINILSTFSWNFVDLFLILISMALADQFHQLNSRLDAIKGKAMPEWWWAEARNDYNHLATLTRRVDSHVSSIVLLSFATDLYFICIQLLYSFNLKRSLIQKIYFFFSFGFLLARTTAVSLYAASIHDESLLPAPILYSVTSPSYSTEVMRFLSQVTTDKISLTGMKFFSITRSLVLTVAGTIVTYELVLVQFNSIQQTDQSNVTDTCNF